MDGRHARSLAPGERVDVEASPFPVPCVNRSSVQTEEEGPSFTSPFASPSDPSPSASDSPSPSFAYTNANEEEHDQGEGKPKLEDDWVRDINNLLQYNATFRSKALLRHGHAMNSFGEGHGR
jgi:NADH kinase